MRTFTYTNSVGQEIEMTEIEDGQGGATQMPKSVWDEQQKAAELAKKL